MDPCYLNSTYYFDTEVTAVKVSLQSLQIQVSVYISNFIVFIGMHSKLEEPRKKEK
jgi:hypothetical protein